MAAARKKKNGQNGHAVQARLNSLRAELEALQDDMKRLVSGVGDAASEGVQGAMSGALQSAQDVVERVEDWGSENIDDAREVVRSQPLAACVLSMGAGALIGALLLR